MFRVLLKVDRVSLRVKETVQLHVLIKKDHRIIHHSRRQLLVNGQAFLSNSSEFLIEAKQPVFELELYLVMGKMKKKGGVVQINLFKYAINTSHRIIAVLQKCPQPNSTMLVDFVYMQTDRFVENQSLISLQQVEDRQHQNYLKEITHQNQMLAEDTKRLSSEICTLVMKNEQLEGENRNLEMAIEQNENNFKQEINRMEEEHNNTCLNLENQKRKIATLVDIINQSGDYALINQLANIIHQPCN